MGIKNIATASDCTKTRSGICLLIIMWWEFQGGERTQKAIKRGLPVLGFKKQKGLVIIETRKCRTLGDCWIHLSNARVQINKLPADVELLQFFYTENSHLNLSATSLYYTVSLNINWCFYKYSSKFWAHLMHKEIVDISANVVSGKERTSQWALTG